MGIRIIGTGKYLPEKIVTNEDMCKIVETSDEWITTRSGIKTRHVATDEFTWEMGAKAARGALSSAAVSPEEIDIVIVSTVTQDYYTPSAACLIAHALSLKSPFCFDLNAACAGFVTAVDVAEKYLAGGGWRTALVVSSEMLTKITDYTDRSTCVLFGDGAGAAVLQKSDGLYESVLGSDPSGGCHLFSRALPPSNQFRSEPFDWSADGFAPSTGTGLHQDGQDVYKFATRAFPRAVKAACAKAGLAPAQLDWIFPHQANLRILETSAKNLGLTMEKVYVNIAENSNISSACIPVSLCEAWEQGILHRGDKICIAGFGGGLVYAASVFEW